MTDEKIKEKRRAYYLKNKHKYSEYYLKNKKLIDTYNGIKYYENREEKMVNSARRRAKVKNLEFNIDKTDIIIPSVCPILGIPIERGKGTQQDSSPSIDRINSNKGYIKGNIQIISYRANTLKNNGTIEEFQKIIDYMKTHQK